MNTYKAKFPFKSWHSFFLVSKIYKALDAFLLKDNKNLNEIICSIELCPIDMTKPGFLETHMVYGTSSISYKLTSLPDPELKPKYSNKK